MEQIFKRVLEENYEHNTGHVEFSESKLLITLKRNEKTKGCIDVHAEADEEFKGFVSSSHYRLECIEAEIVGTACQIHYQFDAAGMEEGDSLQGEICVLSNIGQFYIPFYITIGGDFLETSMGPMKNLFHFANLAKTNWQEAVNCFYHKEFEKIFTGNDRQYLNGYLGLLKPHGNEQNVEEFLIYIHKKQAMQYSLLQDEAELEQVHNGQQEGFCIERNGWGYTKLWVETDADFIKIEKDCLLEEDFLGNSCQVFYCLDTEQLFHGYNVGTIRIHNSYVEMKYKIVVNNTVPLMKDHSFDWVIKQYTLKITKAYLEFSMSRITKQEWIERSEELVEKILGLNNRHMFGRLFQAQLLIVRERFNEAKWILGRVSDMIGENGCTDEEYAYYLYIQSLFERNEEFTRQATTKIKELNGKLPGNIRISWMLLYLESELEDRTKRYLFLEEMFYHGANSPVLYIEAQRILNKNPAYLNKFGEYEKQLLVFLSKYKLYTKDIALQVMMLSMREKNFSYVLYDALCICYELYEGKEIVNAICILLMKDEKIDTKYFKWYHLAVEKELRITKLYEYYLMSMNRDKIKLLPKTLLLYFSYECKMDYQITAYLYHCVAADKERIPDLYMVYEPQIIEFIKKQIKSGRSNYNLAYLYRTMLSDYLLTQELAEEFCKILFLRLIETSNPKMQHVVVVDNRLKEEMIYPFVDGKAYVPVYAQDSCILIEDKKGNRYITGIEYSMKQLLLPEAFIPLLETKVRNSLGFYLYLAIEYRSQAAIAKEDLYGYRYIIESSEVSDSYKHFLLEKLIPFYYDKDYIEEADNALSLVQVEKLRKKERAEYVIYLTTRGNNEKAYETITKYGFEGVPPKVLTRICMHEIDLLKGKDNYKVTALAEYVFRLGRYTEDILTYLVNYSRGSMRQLRDIWKKAGEAGINRSIIAGHILYGCLYSGAYLSGGGEIFASYYDKDADVNLAACYLADASYGYFVKQDLAEKQLFSNILVFYKREGNIADICKLALLEFFSKQKDSLSIEKRDIIKLFINEMIRKEKYFPFFLKFIQFVPELVLYSDDTYVEYRSEGSKKVTIHYVIESHEKVSGHYSKEEMTGSYSTVFYKKFILFFGERLQYYITENRNGRDTLTQSGTIEKNDVVSMDKDSRFSLLNDIVMSNTLQEYDSAEEMCREFARQDYIGRQFFNLK